ncbi:Membrane-bound aldehyde dehydrogenase [pyrroloquinoline-quinone] [Methylovirgula sp. HY1]|nr:molybdopterin cofactor-binding domain-containing protein [Methylovirgula sp. HY1]QXX75750.1 Membrane-bound aldehyde dehydrogenase [pyrroloquinoline-quinone] [Methylovirgula sp. HY1]
MIQDVIREMALGQSTFIAPVLNVSRRSLLMGLGAGLVLATPLSRPADAAEQKAVKKYGGDAMPHGVVDDPHIFIVLAADGSVTVICNRSEMGQGVRTSLPMIVADELNADWARVKVAQAPGDEERYGNEDTDGSRSLRHHFLAMRRCGAAMRMMLEEAAATQWGVPVTEVAAVHHEIVHRASGRKLSFGALAEAASKLPTPAHDKLQFKDPAKFQYIGKADIALIDGVGITTGSANYGIDTRLPGMLYAVIARPPVYGGVVKSFDASETLKVPGVVKVVSIEPTPIPSEFQPLGGIGIIAKNTWAAIKGREKLKIVWDDGPNATYASDTFRKTLETAARQPGKVVRKDGDVYAALPKAAKRVSAEYYIPHLAQAPMEAPAATVQIKDGHCEVWACVQSPQATHDRIAKRLGSAVKDVTVNVTLLGGGFGRKSKPDYAVEAALLSQAMAGTPVKLTWTREDDIQHSYYHTVSVEHIEAGLDASGKPVAWLHRTVAPTIISIFKPDPKHEAPFELGMGAVNNPFLIPNFQVENPAAAAHTRIGWFRSVSNIPHAFAILSFAAELAAAAGRDPKDYLLELIGPPRKIVPEALADMWNYNENPKLYPFDTGRLRAVIEKVADESGWGRSLPKGHGLGIAGLHSFASYTAAVVEVAVGDKGQMTIPRVDIAIDCGPIVNPERIRSQLEGAVIQGISLATLGEITFRNGRAEQSNFDGYQLTRIDAAPKVIKTHILPMKDYDQPLGGVGEPGVPPVAPALLNAVFAATGKRIRQLPLGSQLASG